MNSDFIRDAIRKKFNNYRQYVVVDEVSVTTGWDGMSIPRRIDMIVIDCFESNHYAIEGIEIKISKSDLMRELKDPEKHEVFFYNIDLYTLAAPADLLKECKSLLPDAWGMLAIYEDGTAKYLRKPKVINFTGFYTDKISKGFFASCIRRINNCIGGNTQ